MSANLDMLDLDVFHMPAVVFFAVRRSFIAALCLLPVIHTDQRADTFHFGPLGLEETALPVPSSSADPNLHVGISHKGHTLHIAL